MDRAARLLGGKGEFAIVTASLTAANQNEWIKHIRARLAEKYPRHRSWWTCGPSDDDRKRAFDETQTLLKVHPKVKLVMAIASPAVPGAAEAVKQSGRTRREGDRPGAAQRLQALHPGRRGGLDRALEHHRPGLPDDPRRARPGQRGAQARGDRARGGPAGPDRGRGDNVLLGTPFTFTKDNVDQFDF